MASKSLVETYIVILKNDTVVKQVGMNLVSKFGVSEISKCFTVKNGVISTAELKDAISMSAGRRHRSAENFCTDQRSACVR